MSTIADQNFDIMRGIAAELKARLDIWEVPGLDGFGAQLLGMGDGQFPLTTVAYTASGSDADDLISSCNELQGSLVTVVDDWGNDYESILVVSVNTDNAKKACIFQGNANAVRVQIQWIMLRTAA